MNGYFSSGGHPSSNVDVGLSPFYYQAIVIGSLMIAAIKSMISTWSAIGRGALVNSTRQESFGVTLEQK